MLHDLVRGILGSMELSITTMWSTIRETGLWDDAMGIPTTAARLRRRFLGRAKDLLAINGPNHRWKFF